MNMQWIEPMHRFSDYKERFFFIDRGFIRGKFGGGHFSF